MLRTCKILIFIAAIAVSAIADTAENPVILENYAENPVIRFGDPVKIIIKLQNIDTKPLSISKSSLILKAEVFNAWNLGGSVAEEYLWASDQKSIDIAAGSVATITFIDATASVLSLGPITVSYSLQLGDLKLLRATPDQPEKRMVEVIPSLEAFFGNIPSVLRVKFDISPSELTQKVWAAKTREEMRQIYPQIRELIKLRANPKISRKERNLVANTFAYFGASRILLWELSLQDEDPDVRQEAVFSFWMSPSSTLNYFLDHFKKENNLPPWAVEIPPQDEGKLTESITKLTLDCLYDHDPKVRATAINILKHQRGNEAYLEEIRKRTADPAADVRIAALDFLANYGGNVIAAETILAALADEDEKVRNAAISALEESPQLPYFDSLEQAFPSVNGDLALRLMRLLFNYENVDLAKVFLNGFEKRTPAERLAIMTYIAGHVDNSALKLVDLGLQDKDETVQRAAWMRLAAFPKSTADLLLNVYVKQAPKSLMPLAKAVVREIETRLLFPFLGGTFVDQASASENIFPSQNGTVPMVSPDGQWVAYVETGWRRPGGSGGSGRSNLLSLTHAVRADGSEDRIVSDMFLVGWLADSKHIASSRDGFAAVTDLNGKPTIEFGSGRKGSEILPDLDWRNFELRRQLGSRMPHSKYVRYLLDRSSDEFGEDAAFSPDGQWLGPINNKGQALFIDSNDAQFVVKLSDSSHQQSTWSPDGKYVLTMVGPSAAILNFQTRDVRIIQDVNATPDDNFIESWDYRKARWNPWSKNGEWFAFVRKGQVWIMKPDGSGARQITFDGARKFFPTFSRNGKLIAYVATWHPDALSRSARPAPTDLWIVDIESGIAERATAPAPGKIYSLDWLDDCRLVFDRIDNSNDRISVLKTLALQ